MANDFGIDLTGAKGTLKAHNFYLTATCKIKDNPAKSAPQRTFVIIGGPGCDPDLARGRTVELRLAPGVTEKCSSYDFEYVIKDGKKIYPIPPEPSDAYVCNGTRVETESGACPPVPKTKLVRRKR